MAAAQDLFDLIKSLTRNEKRHFQLHSTLQGEEKNYVRLFEAMDTMEFYDKDGILTTFEGETFVNSLHVTENYLYRKIMEALRAFNEANDKEAQIYSLLTQSNIMEAKGFYKLALDSLYKAEKLAIKYSKQLALIDIAIKKIPIIGAIETRDLVEKTENVFEEAFQYLANIQEELYYRQQNQWMFLMFRKWRSPRNENVLEEMHKRFADFEQAAFPEKGTFYSQYYYYAARYAYYYTLQAYDQSLKAEAKVVEIWERHPDMIAAYTQKYMVQLANYISNAIMCKEYVLAAEIIDRMGGLKTQSFDEEGEQFQNVYFYKHLSLLNQEKFEACKSLVPEIAAGLEKYKLKINPARRLTFFYNITLVYFITECYSEAADWLDKILIITRNDEPRKDIQQFARVLQLAIYYKLSSNEVLEYMFRSVYRNKELKASMSDFELVVLKYFKKLLKVHPDSKEAKALFVKLMTALEEMKEKELKTLGYEAFCIWTRLMVGDKA